jgi:hypothetical protein
VLDAHNEPAGISVWVSRIQFSDETVLGFVNQAKPWQICLSLFAFGPTLILVYAVPDPIVLPCTFNVSTHFVSPFNFVVTDTFKSETKRKSATN